MKHLFSLVFIILLMSLAFAQTNPTSQALPYSQDFSTLPWNSDQYPVGTQGWLVSETPGTEFSTSPAIDNRAMVARSTIESTSAQLHNYRGRIGFLNSDTRDLCFVFSVNTEGKQNIALSYDVMTIRNPYGYFSNNRINEVIMQYRVGIEGNFTNLPGTEYQNDDDQAIDGNLEPQNNVTIYLTLPAACDDQSVLQLRLISRQVSGAGNSYPSFAIDNISVTGEDIPTLPVELSSFIATISANNHISLTWVTQTETAMQGYYVLRASDDQLSTARIVSPMIAATNHSQQQSYVFLDTEVYDSGTYYYWLQANDLDGTTNFHGPVSLIYNPLVDNPAPEIPRFTELRAVFPNPFNPRACIDFYLETPAPVVFRVFDAHGRLVRELEPGSCPAGQQRVEWDGRDAAGTLCGSGIYHIRMDVGARSFTGKAVLLK